MPRRDDLWLADIIEAARKVAEWLTDVTDERWEHDEILRNAVAYQLQTIGEAASSLSTDIRDEIRDVPWRSIRGFRNIIVHQYFAVDWSTVRDTARVAVPHVAAQVTAYLDKNSPDVLRKLDRAD